jgi:hypothetical protein
VVDGKEFWRRGPFATPASTTFLPRHKSFIFSSARRRSAVIYGLFTIDQQAQIYRANVSKRDGIPIDEPHIIDIRVDPEFHWTPSEIIDQRGEPG